MIFRSFVLLSSLIVVLSSSASAGISFDIPSAGVKIRACDDFATQELANPLDMNDTADINNSFPGIDVSAVTNTSFSNGLFSATTIGDGATLYLWSPPVGGSYPVGGRWGSSLNLDTTKYRYLSLRMHTDKADPHGVRLIWDRSYNYATNRSVTSPIPVATGWQTYTVDLSTLPIEPSASNNLNGWASGSITGFAVMPSTQDGANIKIDWIRFEDPSSCDQYSINFNATPNRAGSRFDLYLDDDTNPYNGYQRLLISAQPAAGSSSVALNTLGLAPGEYHVVGVMDSDPGTLVSSVGTITVNQPPVIQISAPNLKGGAAIRPWNMNNGDFVIFENLNSSSDPTYQNELLTTFLPDVRIIGGLRGDFFKGTNNNGSNDPVNYSTFPFGNRSPISFESADYKNLCFKLMIDRSFDLGLGSVARVIWKPVNDGFKVSEDLVLITDGWSGSPWYEYCLNMPDLLIDGSTQGAWNGTIEALRVDAHEFTGSATYYLDYIKLRKDHTSHGEFALVYEIDDADDSPSTSFYYTTGRSRANGTLIGTVQNKKGVYKWDTRAVSNGTYYIYGVANDGTNSTSRLAGGRVVVDNSGDLGQAPVLSLESPSANSVVCSSMQLKGYALQPDRYENVAAVKVLLDNQTILLAHPALYSPNAKAAYPSLDSSNSGFNEQIDLAAAGLGQHDLEVVAVSSSGLETSSGRFTIERSSDNCPAQVEDAPPAGTPTGTDPGGSSQPAASSKPSISSYRLNSQGELSLTFSRLFEHKRACQISIRIGAEANSLSTLVKTFSPKANRVSMTIKKITLNRKKLKTFYIGLSKSCSDHLMSSSAARRITSPARSRGKIANLSTLARRLRSFKQIVAR